MEYNVIWHDTAESVYKEFLAGILDCTVEKNVAECVISCETYGGDIVDMTVDEIINAIREQKCWGFATQTPKAIHIWASPDAGNELILRVIAHECGHLTGDQNEVELFEEQRADEFADVAVRAYQILMARPNDKACEHCGGSGIVTDTEDVKWPCPNKCNQDAPREQPSDEDILQIFADVTHNQEEDARFIDIDRDQAIKIATIFLSRFGAAPQGGEDAQRPVAQTFLDGDSFIAGMDAQEKIHAAEKKPGQDVQPVATVLSNRLGNDTSTIDKALPEGMVLYATPQPAGRDAREVPDEP